MLRFQVLGSLVPGGLVSPLLLPRRIDDLAACGVFGLEVGAHLRHAIGFIVAHTVVAQRLGADVRQRGNVLLDDLLLAFRCLLRRHLAHGLL
jgi:hypothetical protein